MVPNLLGQLGLHFFSVCDGHGLNGHHVSQYIKDMLPKHMEKMIEAEGDYAKDDHIKKMYAKVPEQLNQAFLKVHEELLK